jgi:hypothetical protein
VERSRISGQPGKESFDILLLYTMSAPVVFLVGAQESNFNKIAGEGFADAQALGNGHQAQMRGTILVKAI